MSDVPARVNRAFRDHSSFEQVADSRYESVATPFEGLVDVAGADDGQIAFGVTVRVPMLDEVTEDTVADVVEEGWYETFERRIEDIGGVTKVDRDLDPTVTADGRDAVVEVRFTDLNERRGVDDASALIDYVEGTYVQGIIPGYDYTEPVTSILNHARKTGGSDPTPM